MQAKYKIIEKHPSENLIVVRFYTDATPEVELAQQTLPDGTIARGRTDYSINLPIPAPVGADLDDFVIQYFPYRWFEMKERVLDPKVSADVASIELGGEKPFTPLQLNPRNAAKAEREAAVAAIKVTTAAGNTFDGDEVSQGRMARAVIALNASPGATVNWVLHDNSVIQATAAELTEALALAGQAQAAIWVI